MRLVFPIVTSFIFIIACTTVIAQTASSQANDVTGDSIQQMRFIAEKIGLLPTLQRDEQRLRDTTKALYPLLSAKTVDSIFHSMNFETLALKSARRAFLKHFSTQEFDTLVRFFKQGFFPERSATLKKYDMSQATLMDEMANEYQKVMDYAAN
ncbi:MAG: hypothetical protein JNL32_16325, partial [Candidatus Kapabacteria bacterium]|nr:hypothetical protein [Candidatus Kapabacteria bacterium]